MSKFDVVLDTAKGYFAKNAPTLLTSAGVAGVLSTTVLGARGAVQASRHLEDLSANGEYPSGLDTDFQLFLFEAKSTWKFYVPAAIMGSVTIACIIGANTLHTRRAAALFSAYSLTETAYREYRDQVQEQLGLNKDVKILDGVAKKQLTDDPLNEGRQVFVTGGGEHLCYDKASGRYFKGSVESIRKAQNDLNQQIINHMYASQNDFYRMIGLDTITFGDDVGWNTDKMLEVVFTTAMAKDDAPCIVINYLFAPMRGYSRFG